ncbi:MAG TPA: glycosyltransferase family 2 protein [Terriglobales bacterium]|nr:glycosyltransferase family 2 protein [Terriglobales bacterium]
MKKLISIVVPVYNEEGNVRRLYDRVTAALKGEQDKYDFEFVFTDNHSEDLTFSLLQEMAQQDSRIRAYRFSRNFGFQRSILSGYRLARGDAAVQIDCDLQDPPEIIPAFLRKWEEGFSVVYGIRAMRPESILMRGARRFFYRLVDFLADDRLPHDAGDFRLIDRRVLDVVTRINDTQPYLRGVIAGAGFAQTGVTYDRDERRAGKSKFGFQDLVGLALDAIANHSIVPLKLASLMGLSITLISLLGFFYYLFTSLFMGSSWPRGFATLILVLLFLSGMNALFLGVIGEYLGRIYHQIKVRPNAIVENAIEEGENLSQSSQLAEINRKTM